MNQEIENKTPGELAQAEKKAAGQTPKFKSNANRLWEISSNGAKEKDKVLRNKQDFFLLKLSEYLKSLKLNAQFDKQQALTIYNDLRKINPSDTALFEKLKLFIKSLNPEGNNPAEQQVQSNTEDLQFLASTDYLDLFKSIWEEAIPHYLVNMMKQRELLDSDDLLPIWKMLLRLEQSPASREEVEKAMYSQIRPNYTELLSKVFNGKLPEVYKGDLRINSLTQIQNVWKRENGFTLYSWELKHKAFVKYILMFSAMKVLGTINFIKKSQIKQFLEGINGSYPVNQKEILSTIMKFVKNFLAATSESDPRKAKDHVRIRVPVDFPEGVVESNNINEIKIYVVEKAAEVLGQYGPYISEERLRNSFVGMVINKLSGKKHKALHITINVSVDVGGGTDAAKKQMGCPESVSFEIQFIAPMTKEERDRDDKEYQEKKLDELVKDLGVDIQFDDYIKHTADIFLKDYRPMEERESGGTSELSEKEHLAITLLNILATKDEETINYIKTHFKNRENFYKKKFLKAVQQINFYWDDKMKTFIETHLVTMKNVLEIENSATADLPINNKIKEAINSFISEIRHSPLNHALLKDLIKTLQDTIQDYKKEDPKDGIRLEKVMQEIQDYYSVHVEQIDLESMIFAAQDGVFKLFPVV